MKQQSDIDTYHQAVGEVMDYKISLQTHKNGSIASLPALQVADRFYQTYDKDIKKLPTDLRVNYFMFGIQLLDIDGGKLAGFIDFIDTECGNPCMERMERFVTLGKSNHRYSTSDDTFFNRTLFILNALTPAQ